MPVRIPGFSLLRAFLLLSEFFPNTNNNPDLATVEEWDLCPYPCHSGTNQRSPFAKEFGLLG
jgi:hypothetical protein